MRTVDLESIETVKGSLKKNNGKCTSTMTCLALHGAVLCAIIGI